MILVFAGAGASAAIDGQKYPTTEGFYEKIEPTIRPSIDTVLRGYFALYLNEKKKAGLIDIEDVLSYTADFKHDLGSFSDQERISYTLLLKEIEEGGQKLGAFASRLQGFFSELSSLEREIFSNLHDVYGVQPAPPDSVLWNTFIGNFPDMTVEIFTTNYDLILEKVAKDNEIDTGIDEDAYGRNLFNYDFSDREKPNYKGRLTKLHGSVNWKREGENILIATKDFLPDTNYILYPGDKNIPEDKCFRNMHDHLYYVCGKIRVAIFIGFSFRDEYISQILRSIPSNTRKIIINKGPKEEVFHSDFPFIEENCFYVGTGFTKNSWKEIKDYVDEGLEVGF